MKMLIVSFVLALSNSWLVFFKYKNLCENILIKLNDVDEETNKREEKIMNKEKTKNV